MFYKSVKYLSPLFRRNRQVSARYKVNDPLAVMSIRKVKFLNSLNSAPSKYEPIVSSS